MARRNDQSPLVKNEVLSQNDGETVMDQKKPNLKSNKIISISLLNLK